MDNLILFPLLALVLFILAVILLRTARFPIIQRGRDETLTPDAVSPDADGELVAAHLGRAIQIRAVSNSTSEPADPRALHSLHRLLEELYPRAHSVLKKELVNNYSLLYTWEGTHPDLPGILLMAHLDVVPAEEADWGKLAGQTRTRGPDRAADEAMETLEASDTGEPGAPWKYPPFSGQIAEGYVWGRGSLDIKCTLIGLMEAVEALLKTGYKPPRPVYLAFGHDEELGGLQGAAQISALLEQRGVKLECVLDEGGLVAEDELPGVKAPVAMIGTMEKGYLSVELAVEDPGGHSSTPPDHTAIGILAGAIQRLEANPFPPRLKPMLPMMRHLGADLPVGLQMLFANLWLTRDPVVNRLTRNRATNAVVRTTQAVTIIHGGVKDNVLPSKASAVVNFRLLPGDTLRGVYERTVEVIKDPRVVIAPADGAETLDAAGWNPTPPSALDSTAFLRLTGVIRAHFPQAAVAPYIVVGATDSRHYTRLSDSVYRFMPVVGKAADLARIHGTNERIAVAACGKMVAFYIDLIKTLGQE